ncbi:MAG: regulatory protein RecX [Lautropia sp.]|nr:regulatory protein RecX [Lautropia sp.]
MSQHGHDSLAALLAHDDSPAAQRSALKRRAIALLARREHSRAELMRKLQTPPAPRRRRQPGAEAHPPPQPPSPALVQSVLDELAELRLLSDQRMAESLVRSGASRFGAARLSQELQRKGLSGQLVADALAPLAETERERAQEVWQRRFGQPPTSLKERARQYRFLQGRGFPARIVSAVVPGVCDADAADDDEWADGAGLPD